MAGNTLAFCGMDRTEEARLRGLLAETNDQLKEGWTLVAESEATTLLIDLDTMYGQMAWLTNKSGGKIIIALTAAMRADTDHLLQRPGTAAELAEILNAISSGQASSEGEEVSEPSLVSTPAHPAPPETPITTAEFAAPSPEAVPVAEITSELRLIDYLRPGALSGPALLKDSLPKLVVDPVAKTWLGGTALKPLLPLATRKLGDADWEPLSPADYARLKSELGGEQPLSRLIWLAALGAGEGRLLGDLSTATRFKLVKYPQSEREFPRHFRIGTTMLKQLASIEELAAASGASTTDVADFINAAHTLGIVEAEGLPAAATAEVPRAGLLNRLRGKK
jgi:hypothetical protein